MKDDDCRWGVRWHLLQEWFEHSSSQYAGSLPCLAEPLGMSAFTSTSVTLSETQSVTLAQFRSGHWTRFFFALMAKVMKVGLHAALAMIPSALLLLLRTRFFSGPSPFHRKQMRFGPHDETAAAKLSAETAPFPPQRLSPVAIYQQSQSCSSRFRWTKLTTKFHLGSSEHKTADLTTPLTPGSLQHIREKPANEAVMKF